jgi:hypothetical protein
MAKDDITSKAAQAYATARENQYVNRLVEDEELRDSIIAAFTAARTAYGRVSKSKSSPVEAVNDRKVKRDLQSAAASLKEASERIREPKRKGHPFRNLFAVGLLTGGLVLIFSESARKSLLDAVFGAEEEFVYTSTTSSEGAPATNGTPVE